MHGVPHRPARRWRCATTQGPATPATGTAYSSCLCCHPITTPALLAPCSPTPQAGQALAARYLTGAGRTCYWYRLLHGLAGSLAFRPTLVPWPRAVPVREVVQRQLLATEEGRKLWAEAWEP